MHRTRHIVLSAAIGSVAVVTLLAAPRAAHAAGYASSITESAGTVSFVLNQDANVTIVRDGVSTNLGNQAKGTLSFTRDGAANYQILVQTSSATGGYQDVSGALTAATDGQPIGTATATISKISDDANAASRFSNPHGLAVNTNPTNGALFGRVYVTNSSAGTVTDTTVTPNVNRNTGDGLYALNADLTDAIGQGDTAKTGGITSFGTSVNAPWKLSIDDAGAVYITDQVDAVAGLHRIDGNLSDGSGTNVLIGTNATKPAFPSSTLNHGSIYGAVTTGSIEAGNLAVYAIDEDLATRLPDTTVTPAVTAAGLNSLWRWDVGSTTTDYAGTPTQLAKGLLIDFTAVNSDLARSKKSGKFYLMQNRADGNESGLFVVAPDGVTPVFSSRTETINLGLDANPTLTGTQDVLRVLRSVDVSPDEHSLVSMTNNSQLLVVPLIDGLPDIANRAQLAAFGNFSNTGWDATYDAAGNIYATATNGTAKMVRVFAPGAISQTVYGSDGTFTTITEQSFNGSGNLSDSSHWLLNSVANGNDAVMSIGNLTGGTQTITSDAGSNAARIRFSGGNYTIGGSGTITMGAGVLEPRIIAEAGNHTITAPIQINDKSSAPSQQGLGVAAYAGATLTLTNVNYQSQGFYKITKWSDGTVVMPTFKQGKLDIKAGTLKFSTPATGDAAYTTALQIAGTAAAPTATLDLGASGIVYDYPSTATTSPYANVVAQIKAGFNNGTWTGKGITSSRAAADSRYAIGIIDAATLSNLPSFFMGVPVIEGTNLFLRVTFKGDSDLNGKVEFADLLTLAKNYNGVDKTWATGDSDYNGKVEFADLLNLAKNYNQTLSASQSSVVGEAFAADFALAQSLVPEPATLGAILGLGGLVARRRRRA